MAESKSHTARVTGGSRGIGAAIVAELQSRGVNVLAPRRDELDLASPESIEGFIASHAETAIDILINNAGINVIRPLSAIDADAWSLMYQVNLHAPFRLIQALAPRMQAAGWGRIINISSIFSLVTKEQRLAYSTMKSGLNGMTRTAAVELAPSDVLVNAVCPGYVETELTRQNNSPADLERIAATIPLRRLAQPAEIARLVGFLSSEENSYLTGQLVVIDGGFLCL
jgi:3-oxoacyl-[acyl-carrier protein] reductase